MKNWFRYQIPILFILVISLGITTILWRHEQGNLVLDQEKSISFNLREVTSSIEQRMAAYEQVLRGAQGLYAASAEVSRSDFQMYIETLQLGANYSGIQGVGTLFIVPHAQKEAHVAAMRKHGFPHYAITPAGTRDSYAPIVQLEPAIGSNLLMLGSDMYTMLLSRTAMEESRDSGAPAITGKMILIKNAKNNVHPGFSMFLPLYKKGAHIDTLAARRANIIGWVVAPFRINNLMGSLYGQHSLLVGIKIYDGVETTSKNLLYESQQDNTEVHHSRDAYVNATEYIEVGGRTWTLIIHSLPGLKVLQTENNARLIVVAGVGLSLLLTLLTWALLSGRDRAIALAQEMTQELRNSEARFRHQAQHDTLTGLPNRALFNDRLEQALAQAKRQHKRLALLFIDLDAFKPINDDYGHHIGDVLLKEVAARMLQHVRASDTVARIGGDEFVVLLTSIEEAADAVVLAEVMRRAIGEPVNVPDGIILNVSSSIGVAVYPENGIDETQLARNADTAMYCAKQEGRNKVSVYKPPRKNH